MKKLQKELLDEIFETTRVIQKRFPELYKNLQETPLFLQENEPENDLSTHDFRQYLESLKKQLATFEKTAAESSIF